MRVANGALASLLISAGTQAQVPPALTYQGRLLDASGAPKSGFVNLQFAIFDDPTSSANRLWCEKQSVALSDGYYVVYLGTGAPCQPPGQGALTAAFGGPNRYLELSVEDSALAPRTRIASVPFAFAAASIVGSEYIKAQTATPQKAGFNIGGTGYVTGPAPFVGSGKVTAVVNESILRGLDTRFGTEVLPGDLLAVGDQKLRVSTITDASNLTVDGNWTSSQVNVNFQIQKPAAVFFRYATSDPKPPPSLIASAEGNVGIGTHTPQAALHVAGRIRIDSTPKTGIEGLELNRIDEDGRDHHWILWHMDERYGKNSLQFWEYRADSGGKFCGGSSEAMCNKRVEIQSGGNVVVSGSVTATAFVSASSRTFKEAIRELGGEEAMTTLAALRPSHFRYRPEYGGEEHIGFVAEDTPDLVRSSDGKAVKTGDMVALLAKVAQEQQKMLRAQQAMLKQLGTENDALRTRLDHLERRSVPSVGPARNAGPSK